MYLKTIIWLPNITTVIWRPNWVVSNQLSNNIIFYHHKHSTYRNQAVLCLRKITSKMYGRNPYVCLERNRYILVEWVIVKLKDGIIYFNKLILSEYVLIWMAKREVRWLEKTFSKPAKVKRSKLYATTILRYGRRALSLPSFVQSLFLKRNVEIEMAIQNLLIKYNKIQIYHKKRMHYF